MDIISTVGPKTKDKYIIKELIDNGTTIFRLNCSHFYKEQFEEINTFIKREHKNIKIMVDLCGRKVRVSRKLEYVYKVYIGEEVYFCSDSIYKELKKNNKEKKIVPLNINEKDFIEGKIKSISMKDNTMKFKVIDEMDSIIRAIALDEGVVRGGKGCNIVKERQKKSSLSQIDKGNIDWAIKNNVDIICQSFVEDQEDIREIRKYLNNRCDADIWAKIETEKGIDNIIDIIKEVDTVVIGRGDLIPESNILKAVKLENIIINECIKNKKNIIIGTHILDSMKKGNQPNLNETESISFFIEKNIKGFLLAGETSIGVAPVKTVKFLKDAIEYFEGEI